MRHLLIVIMIALLPLRIWAGDVMALEMAMGQSSGSLHAATPKIPDCHGQNFSVPIAESDTLNASGSTESLKDSSSAEQCDTCGSCQLCHSVAFADMSFSELPSPMPSSLLSSDSKGFASARRALGFKPPIS